MESYKDKYSDIRKEDVKMEEINNSFLNKYFYKAYCDKFIYNKTKKLQTLGIDVIFILNNKQYNCDEKIAANYINKKLNSFSFELSFINRGGQLQDGWFIDKNKVNNSYLFCWIDNADSNKPKSIDEIRSVEVVLITKYNVNKYLESIGWDRDKLVLKSAKIRNKETTNLGNISSDGIKFCFSEQFVEKPINFILSRQTLRDYSDFNKIINVNKL